MNTMEIKDIRMIWQCKKCGKDTVSLMTGLVWDGPNDYMCFEIKEIINLKGYELYCWTCDDLCHYALDENGVAIS